MSRPERARNKAIARDAREEQPARETFADQSDRAGDGGPPPYDDWSDKQLMDAAAHRGIPGYDDMDRDELLDALKSPDAQRSFRDADAAGENAGKKGGH